MNGVDHPAALRGCAEGGAKEALLKWMAGEHPRAGGEGERWRAAGRGVTERPRPGWRSTVGDRQSAAARSVHEDLPVGRKWGGDGVSSLDGDRGWTGDRGRSKRKLEPAMEHAELRWPKRRHARHRTGSLQAATWWLAARQWKQWLWSEGKDLLRRGPGRGGELIGGWAPESRASRYGRVVGGCDGRVPRSRSAETAIT